MSLNVTCPSTEEPAGIPPGHPEHREHAAAARINTEIDQEFIMNNEQRRKFRRMHNLISSDTIFECACSENSMLGEMCESVGVEGIRLSRETIDLARTCRTKARC